MRPLKLIKRTLLISILVWAIFPQNLHMPVENADSSSYNQASFWYYPWGKSVTHKGVDIFAAKGTTIRSSVPGMVVYTGLFPNGGNVALVIGPRWRLHYYAHLNTTSVEPLQFVSNQSVIGTVGDSGNAKGKPAHLHYSILTLIPYPWRIDGDRQGWKKMFYLNPIDYFD
jgi:peptidoglycan LD-endopeptidase LytH